MAASGYDARAVSTRIRFATPEDAELLHRFVRELAEYEREPDAVEVTVGELRAQLSQPRPPFECFIAERDGEGGVQPLGFALFFGSYSTWRGRPGLYLEDLYVPSEHRGAGIGRALLAALARLARDRGCARLEWSVLDWNAPAIGFYERLGATPRSEWTTYRLTGEALEQLAEAGAAAAQRES
jgi:GNAT superfamily N-acetyltransferase